MHRSVLLLLHLALLAATAGVNEMVLYKCCDVYEMLSADGNSCVEAPWPRNVSFHKNDIGLIVPPLDKEWVRRWLPPGLLVQNIHYVLSGSLLYEGHVHSVNSSSLWNSSLLQNETLFRNTIAFLREDYIARLRPGGGFRRAKYCVDAVPPPLGNFAMKVKTVCTEEECAMQCCGQGKLLKKNNDGHWNCENDAEGKWSPSKSFLAVDPEFPSRKQWFFKNLHLSSWEVRDAHQALQDEGIIQTHFSTWETCFDYFRSSEGSLHEGLFYQEFPRITRGVYWLLRPLCILSALLLLASLTSFACDKNMRRNIHGRCLANHAGCLLAFNTGQIWYYIAISDRMDETFKEYTPVEISDVCKYVALSMYFLLTAAWFWLTALCMNMAKGFSLQVTRPKKESSRRFLALSAFAWGLPVLLTITCSFLHARQNTNRNDVRWYNPSLAESRVCYNEYIAFTPDYTDVSGKVIYIQYFLKSGSALFYFGPVTCLVICNIICLALTLRKVQYLKRDSSVLRRGEGLMPLGQRHPEGNNPASSHTATGHGNIHRTSIDAKTIKLYIKMILMTGVTELLTEIIMWSTTLYDGEGFYTIQDLGLAYRSAGYVTDLFRAAVVTWLAAPDGGYLGLVRKLRPGKGDQKSARSGGAGRRKQIRA